ncbi:hypothetical protein HPB47_021540, partial [Ixodes persulcatus]
IAPEKKVWKPDVTITTARARRPTSTASGASSTLTGVPASPRRCCGSRASCSRVSTPQCSPCHSKECRGKSSRRCNRSHSGRASVFPNTPSRRKYPSTRGGPLCSTLASGMRSTSRCGSSACRMRLRSRKGSDDALRVANGGASEETRRDRRTSNKI